MRSLLILLLFPAILTAGIFGRRAQPTTAIAESDTLYPGVTYYYPSGLASAEASWYNNGEMGQSPSIFSYGISVDSILGYDDPCSLRVEALFGYEDTDDTLQYIAYDDGWVIFNHPFHVVPRDTAWLVWNVGLPAHEGRRFKITVTDTLLLKSFRETPARP